MKFLELKIPPPVVALIAGLAMWGAFRHPVAAGSLESIRLPLTFALVIAGMGFDLAGLVAFRRARTTINPLKPQASSAIVVSGIYRVTRNPMYVGLVCMQAGLATYLWAWGALLGPLAFAAYIGRFQIVPEERILAQLFGDDYAAYKARVRRWL